MSTPDDHDKVREMLGAYALDAVEADESTPIIDHLRECAQCRAEVAEHRETASLLASGNTPVPAELWDRIADSLDAPAEEVALRALVADPGGNVVASPADKPVTERRWSRVLLAAAAVVVMVALSAGFVTQNRRLDRMQRALDERGLSAAALAAFDDPSANPVTLESDDGALTVQAVVLENGSGFLLAEKLPALAGGRTYQLWAQVGDELVSAGVFGPDPEVVAFHVDGDVGALALTDEIEGGVVRSEQPVVVAGTV